jgi:hypothetical protein
MLLQLRDALLQLLVGSLQLGGAGGAEEKAGEAG